MATSSTQIRTVDFLPEIFQTPVNKQFLSATLDQLVQEPQFKQTQGYIGRKVGPGVNANDKYVIEPTAVRDDYQLEPGVVQVDPADSHKIVDAITYPGITDALNVQGATTTNPQSLYTSDYYTWDPFVDFDKFVNYAQYYWLPDGPLAVDVSSEGYPLTDTFTVTRSNGYYTFSGYEGNNPAITLVRGGSYNFNVAQNNQSAIEFRVTNNTTSWAIDYEPNPTLTLVRGNTYTFNLTQTIPLAFWIKTELSFGTTNIWSEGVFNNGASTGLITFTVPQNAPDTLYYCNDTQFNFRGQFNIVDGTPGTGPGFWIQTDPGVDGKIPTTPNISSRDVLGVTNNGTDLGTVTFDVPLATAQDFYYNMPSIGTVDLITTLNFDQINNQFLTTFFAENPTGIDGITNLNNRTVVFINNNTDPVTGGWQQTTFFDPLPNAGNVISGLGSFDSTSFSETTPITDPAVQFSVWQIQYLTDSNNNQYMSLQSIEQINDLNKFSILFGIEYASTGWYKNALGLFEQIPLLTASKNTLFYQDGTDPNLFGQINIINESLSSTIHISDIVGSPTYISPNGVKFSNGMKVVFRGNVIPASYQNNEYYVEGVGTAIQLLPVTNFITPEVYTNTSTIPYDSTPYSSTAYDGAQDTPLIPDYLTINRASPDLDPWSRSNRWFHIDVINASAAYNNTVPVLDNNFRAARPILEYRAGTRLYNFGTSGKSAVNIIDFTQTDALRTVSGSTGYGTDGYSLSPGSTIIFAADLDPVVRRTIYQVQFVTPDTVPPLIPEPIIVLTPTADSPALVDQNVVIIDGLTQKGISYRWDGVNWVETQQKTQVNQPPLFDIYDSNGISFGDSITYPSTSFKGSPLFSYAISTGAPDLVLGFPITYLSLTNIGDIVFDNNFYADSFNYTIDQVGQTIPLSTGFVRQYSDRVNFVREIGWQTAITPSLIRQQFQFTYDGSPLQLDVAVNENTTVPAVQIFVNATFQESYNYKVVTGTNTTTINLLTTYVPGDLIEVLVLSNQTSATAFYEVPINLENNPFNGNSKQFTLGTIRNHYSTIAENLIALSGPIIGANNTRDLGNIIPYGLQILQQSSPLTLTGYFMRDPNYDIFGALDYNSREYIKFKSLLLQTVTTFSLSDYGNWTVAQLLDAAIAQINLGDTNLSPFYWSDMLPTGSVFTSNSTTVNAITTNVFNTTQTYNFTESNYQGLLVYINNRLLTRNYDYVVSVDSPVLTITVPLVVGDIVTINEYSSTTGNFVPNTPTKLGLYPKYKPEIFLDEDYVNPTLVIQGHDGSITVAFGDIRDQVLLEFETRIFNNLKNDGNPPPLVSEDVIPGYFRTTDYTQAEINQILGEEFLSWVGYNKVDYTTQTYIANNPYTYNYSQAGNKLNGAPLLGAWRGIYRYFYDTLTPNITPWEMLGFSEMPIWWETRYGPVPYTSDNLVLWGDLEAGYVADPVAPYINPKYIRPGLTQVIPVDSQGQLISPMQSVVGKYNPQGFVKSWVVGDGGPVEASWWMSSSYPFAVMRLLALTRPAEFFSLFADRDLYRYNAEFDQYLYNNRYRINPANIQVYGNGVSKASYINWIVDYNQQLGLNSTTALTTDLANLDVRLCYRAASFIAQTNLNLYLEKSNPNSNNSTLLVPPESYNLILYKNQPFDEITYSSVIVEVGDNGYTVYGYSNYRPYFPILSSKINGNTQTLTGGNISVTVPSQYSDKITQIPYGYTFSNLTSTVDFILSYGAYLDSQGMTFTQLENGYVLNWQQMAQEFLYFANQGWAPGTIINLNPAATQVAAYRPGSVVDSIVNYTPENMLLDQNRQQFNAKNLVIQRDGDSFIVRPAPGGSQTISFLQLKFTDYEDMIVLDNTTIFNDLIYDPITAERQNRLMMKAATSTQWNGTLDAQGFILNQNNVKAWSPNTKYTKGEIVTYKNSYWQAANLIQPTATFDYANWYKSNYNLIQQGLLQNLALKADQLANSYNTQTANLNTDNDLLSFGLIGFCPRQYMVDLNLDSVSQVNLYQQFIKTKGTLQAADLFTQVDFNKETGQYNIYEDWGILVGTYGANANRSWFDVRLNEALLTGNPSTVQIINPGEITSADQTVYLNDLWSESYKIPTTDILPTVYSTNLDTALPSAGYVNLNDVDITVFNLNDPSSIAAQLSTIGNGTKIWVAQDNSYSWNIYQCVQVTGRLIQLTNNLNSTSIAQFSGLTTGLSVGDLIIIRYFDPSVDGVYRVLSIPSINSVVIEFSFTNLNKNLITGVGIAFSLQSMRVSQASDIVNLPYADSLIPGSMAWVDNDGLGHWEVIQKQNPFSPLQELIAVGLDTLSLYGASVSQSKFHYSLLVGAPNNNSGIGTVYTYSRDNVTQAFVANSDLTLPAVDVMSFGNAVKIGNQEWMVVGASASNSSAGYAVMIYQPPATNNFIQTQLLVAPDENFDPIEFGTAVTISNNERWMYIGAPNGNVVYAYGRVDIPVEIKTYVSNGASTTFNYDATITINSTYPQQLTVVVGNTTLTYGTDYVLSDGNVQFYAAPASGQQITLVRTMTARLTYSVSTISVEQYLYTATNIESFTVKVNGIIQRPYIDYTFSGGDITFINLPSLGDTVTIDAGTYWQYINSITVAGLDVGAKFGISVSSGPDGRQILIGASRDTATDSNGNTVTHGGSVYAFDRSVIRYIITNSAQTVYPILGSYTDPVAVILNNQFLTNSAQYTNGQFTVSGSNIILSSSVVLTPGDILEIETNQFQQIQKIVENTVFDESAFGQAIDICSNNCSVYIGAPLEGSLVAQSGLVQRQVNQSRLYGVTTSTIANPTLTPGDTIRINDSQVIVPDITIQSLITAINTSGIPNVIATATPNVTLYGDGSAKIFDIGNIYSSTYGVPTTVVYLDSVLQISGVDYTYNNTTQQLAFVATPSLGSVIEVVSGRMTLSVINAAAAVEYAMLTVLPGVNGTAFDDLGFVTYAYTQTITSPNPSPYAHFGSSLSLNNNAVNLVVGAPNGNVYQQTTFDNNKTYFDEHSTTFFNEVFNSGVAYTFDYLPSSSDSLSNPGKFVFGQQLYNNILEVNDQFGFAVSYVSNRVVVGSPGLDIGDDADTDYDVTVFDNVTDEPSWKIVHYQQAAADVNLLNSVYSYNKLLNSTQTYFDFIDPLQGKILGVARRNIDYIGAVDPGSYNTGSVHNIGTKWGAAHIGEIWWDTNTVRFIDPGQDDIVYASRRWGQTFPGSRVDIYQWVESTVPPASYTGPGTPFSTISYTVESSLNNSGVFVTNYYFWVTGITTINNTAGKTLSTTGISNYILNPLSSGLPYIAALNASTIALYNAKDLLSASDTILHVEYDRQVAGGNNDIHTEYAFIADGRPSSFLNPNLYRKFLDSFAGQDISGNLVPDPLLSPGMQFGVQYRPRQSMFADRFTALENYLGRANNILAQYPISETRNFNLLNSSEPTPAANSGAWNFKVPNLEILYYQDLSLVPLGYLYLVESDSSQKGRWTIYEVAQGQTIGSRVLNLVRVQSYDTPLYWNYINWYLPGYNSSIQPLFTVENTAGLQTLSLSQAPVGTSVKVVANGQGKYEIYLRTGIDPVTGWKRVGLEDGTIAFKEELWNYSVGNFGFGAEVFDAQYFDEYPAIETRQIIRAINEELFIDDLLIERNQSLILMFKYIYSEFSSPYWLIKTSFIEVDHVIRGLEPFQLYQPDNQTFVLDYLQEVKPYHVQNLSFNLIYDGLNTWPGMLTDYDVPAYWNSALDIPQFVSPVLTPYTLSTSLIESTISDAAPNAQIWLERPWSDWFNNYLLSVQDVVISNGGSGYTIPPEVVITGTCTTPAQLSAVINSAGQVVAINIINPGSGYSTTPVITLTGGNGSGATAVVQMGNNLVRSIKTTIKYDRYQYSSNILEWQPNTTYTVGTQVRWSNIVWSANSTISGEVFVPDQWTRIPASDLSGVDRTMGYYVPGQNMPGLSLPLLINGIDYPGVQVTAPTFSQNTGFDVGNFDINPFDNISYDASGRPTYSYGILDAQYSSSYLDLYLGTRATDINVDGGAYIDTYSSHAPEELIPGSEFDTLDMRVYTTPGADWTGQGFGFPAASRRYVFDPLNPVLSFYGILENPMVVILFNATSGLALEPLSYNWANWELTVDPTTSAPGDTLVLYVTGTGGGNQLYNYTCLGSQMPGGNTIIIPFPVPNSNPPLPGTVKEFVIYNGEIPLYQDVDYTYAALGENQTQITFTATYTDADRINLSTLGYPSLGGWSLPVFETIIADGNLTIPLTNSLQGTNPVNLIVVVNGTQARPYEGARYISDGSQLVYELPTRGGYNQSLVANNDVSVFVDQQELILGVDFVVDPYVNSLTPRTITLLGTAPREGSVVLVSVRTAAQYWVDVADSTLSFRPSAGLKPSIGDIIEIISWNDTTEQGILTQVFVGPTEVGVTVKEGYDSVPYDSATIPDTTGSYDYTVGTVVDQNIFDTGRIITTPERLLVTINGRWAFNGLEYIVEGSNVIILGPPIALDVVISIVSFTEYITPDAMAFRVFQDMRGIQATYSITPSTTTTIVEPISINSDIIYVENVLALTQPSLPDNIWGVLTVGAERIMYRYWDSVSNTVSGLLRGTAGTAVSEHEIGSTVYNLGENNLLPLEYQDYTISDSTLADGYATTFVAENISLEITYAATWTSINTYNMGDAVVNAGNYYRALINVPANISINNTSYWQPMSRAVQVFVGGALQNGNYTITDENPVTVVFTEAPAAGAQVTIEIRRGKTWYQQGPFSASDGVPLQETDTIAARFLRGL